MLNNTQARLFSLCHALAVGGLIFGCSLESNPKTKSSKTYRARFRGTTPLASDDIAISAGDTAWLAPGEKLTLLASTKLPGAQLKWEGIANGTQVVLSQDASLVFEAPALSEPCETKKIPLTASATQGQTVKSRTTTVVVQNKHCLLKESTGISSKRFERRPVDMKSALGGERLYAELEFNGRTYYAGDGGIWEYRGDKFIDRFDGSQWNGRSGFLGISSNRSVRALAADESGNIWLGLQSGIFAKGGLVQFQPATNDTPNPSWTGPIALPGAGNDIRALAVDSWSNLWIATDKGLVQRSSNGVFTNFGANSGLPSNDILDVAYDKGTGNLWIETSAGVERWSLAQLR
jgi:hypothetical protein